MIIYGKKSYLLSNLLMDLKLSNELHLLDNFCLFFMTPISIENNNDLNKYNDSQLKLKEAILLCNENNLKFLYASSEAILKENSIYSRKKIEDEQCIKKYLNNYIVFRIPRVYSQNRNKGLIYKIKNNLIPEKDYLKKVEYITLNEFINWIKSSLNLNGIINYPFEKHNDSIKNIKNIFNL